MLTPRRVSTASPTPLSPLGAIIPRPSSAASQAPHTRAISTSDGGSSDTTDSRNVRVVVRIRPSLADDTVPPRLRNVLIHPISSSDVRIDVDPAALAGNSGLTTGVKRHPTFSFDHVLGAEANQVDLYDVTAKEVVEEYMKGHNVTFLAYGQTSSGKSYSMGTTGEDMDYAGTSFTPRTGLIPRTVRAIFDRAEEIRLASGSGSSWECRLSFLELYNEEIIDLLSGAGVQISIREERDGRIIWAGVREVKVKTLAEVMQLLQDGSARRQTGATGMNESSSRSHAIFSLTMVQKKRSGMSVSLSQPISPPGTPKTLKRPTSFIGLPRSSTPSGTRGGPPVAFAQKASGIPRPSSMMGHRDDDFVIVTSKFNMVDLAGSERLKRTAAQGERMKEGISINSGLSALGNVISALSDPRSAKGHIPYRDSKLTRMLQDSIGGNALTTMIACVSPIEYNVAETLNTIKYASRARNIKNTSKVNAVEAGWDDVEHLQSTVIKLRKQIAALDTDGQIVGAPGMAGKPLSGDMQRQSEKLIQRLAELQKEHTELYDRYLAKCNENMRLSSELKSATPGDADVLARFNETVEPVILEYEKVVAALNLQLDDLRAQLSLLDTLYEEQGRGLVEAQERQTQSESYASELRVRVAKLNERNSASESYIGDLEAKLKTHDEAAEGRSDASAELRREISKLKETNASLTQHTTEIEARLVQSEERSGKLNHQIESLEREIIQRETAYKERESHIALMDTTQDNKELVAELEFRNRQIAELEKNRLEREKEEQAEKSRLEKLLEAERSTQEDLRRQLSHPNEFTPPPSRLMEPTGMAVSRNPSLASSTASILTPPETPERTADELTRLRTLLEEMSKKAAAAENKYTEARARVDELQIQLVEVREAKDTVPFTPSISLTNLDEISENGSTLHTPRDLSPAHSPSRSKRGSMPILSSTGFSNGAKGAGFRGGRGYGESRRNRPQSLSQELSSAQQSLTSPRGSWASSNSLLFGSSPSRQSMPVIKPLRTQQSIESELKFVHRVIEERDEELRQKDLYIRQLESSVSLQTNNEINQHNIPSRKTSAQSLCSTTNPSLPLSIPLPPSPDNPGISLPSEDSVESLRSLPDTPSTSEEGHQVAVSRPDHEAEFYTPAGEIADPLMTEHRDIEHSILSEMKVKEASQRQIIEQQFKQIADLQKINLQLREELNGGYPELYRNREQLRQERLDIADQAPSPITPTPSSPFVQTSPSFELNKLRDAHADELQSTITGHAQTIEAFQRECDERIAAIETQMSDMFTTHENELVKLKAHHTDELSARQQTHDDAVAQIRHDAEAMTVELNASLASHDESRRQLKMKADQALFELSRIRDEHQIQRNTDAKQIADLQQAKTNLEEAVNELEASKVDWMKRNGELEQRFSRKIIPPPQGPPPNLPLPPTPSGPSASASRGLERSGSNGSKESSGEGKHDSLSQVQDIAAALPLLPTHVGAMIQAVIDERASATLELETMQRKFQEKLVYAQDAEHQLSEQVEKSQILTRELADARKTTSKLRAHLEDSRQEHRRQQEECRAHMEELSERRQQVTRVEESKRSERDSLLHANAQVAALKAQLEKAVDAKVNKKMLKCF